MQRDDIGLRQQLGEIDGPGIMVDEQRVIDIGVAGQEPYPPGCEQIRHARADPAQASDG